MICIFVFVTHRIVYMVITMLYIYIVLRCIILFLFQFFLLVCYLQRKHTKTLILTDVCVISVCVCEGVRVCTTCVRTYVQIIFVYFAHQAFCLICLFDFRTKRRKNAKSGSTSNGGILYME